MIGFNDTQLLPYSHHVVMTPTRHLILGSVRIFRDICAMRTCTAYYLLYVQISSMYLLYVQKKHYLPKISISRRNENEGAQITYGYRCSRCMVAQYFSRGCQVSASSMHRFDCDMHVMANQHAMSIQIQWILHSGNIDLNLIHQ